MLTRNKRHFESTGSDQTVPDAKIFATNNRNPLGTNKLYQPLKGTILGTGAFGNVNIWYHHSSFSLCAAKSFKEEESFTKEFDIIKGLKHSNVVCLLTSYKDQLTLIFEMFSYSLHELIYKNVENELGLSESLVYTLIKNMSDALKYLFNEQSIVHRDIKPQNILFNEHRKTFSLADFGLALSFERASNTYRSKFGGTRDYAHPSLPQNDEENVVSIDTELWPLAVTYFVAATGQHPFHTITREKKYKLMLNKEDQVFWIDERQNYHSDLRNIFNQLSENFQTSFFIPLLLEMMSKNATLTKYFSLIENNNMYGDQIIHVFDVEHFHLIHLTKDRFNFHFTVDTILGYDKNVLKAYQNGILLTENSELQETSDTYPVVLFGNKSKINAAAVKAHIIQRHRFEEVNWDIIPIHKRLTVFKVTVKQIELITQHMKLVRELSLVMYQRVVQKENQLNFKWNDISFEMEKLAEIKVPDADLTEAINLIGQEIKKHSCVNPFAIIATIDVLNLKEVVTFFQNVSMMNQSKLKRTKTHTLNVQIACENAVEAVLNYVSTFIDSWFIWIETTTKCEAKIKDLIDKIEFVSKELKITFVNKIKSLS